MNRLHDLIDAGWRVLERAHDAVETLRHHRLFPNRKVFGGAVVTGLGYLATPLLAKTGIDIGPVVPPAAGFITAYFFTDGPQVRDLGEGDHTAIDTEERVTREDAARKVAERT